jgi:hypothetical protein
VERLSSETNSLKQQISESEDKISELTKAVQEGEETQEELRAAVDQRDAIIAKAKEKFIEQKQKFSEHLHEAIEAKDSDIENM